MSAFSFLLYPLLVVPMVLLLYAQSRVRRVFAEEDQHPNAEEITGLEAARELLNQAGLHQVRIEIQGGVFSDQYNPMTKTLRLSPRIARRDSTLAVGVAGHEVGHAIQDAEGYTLMRVHNVLARWLLFATTIIPIAFIGGFLFGSVLLMLVAVGILGLQVVFALVALPLERNASKRALYLLEQRGVILHSEEGSVQRVLRAAAFTYLASVGIRLAFFLFWFVVLASATGLITRL
ncbi:MAG: zinc metallopeptidase [Actinobacteria bacterium]|nr:zinc metallopeptidase [Actinomycetota bacterium]